MSKRLMVQKKKDNTVECIIAHYMDERAITLTPTQNIQRQRCEAAFTMLISDYSITQVIGKLMKLYKIDKSTAYRTMNQAEQVFGSVRKFNKDAWRFIQIERKRKHITDCKLANRWDLVVKLEEQIDKLIGFDKDELAFDPDKVKAQSYDLNISKKMEAALEKLINKGPFDMNALEAEDISHEELPNS